MKHETIIPPVDTASAHALAGAIPGLAPRMSRREVDLTAQILLPDGKIVEVALLDLSSGGCKLRTADFLSEDETVQLAVPRRGLIDAQVRWCKEGMAGIEFNPEPKPPTPAKAKILRKPRGRVERNHPRINTEADVLLSRTGAVNFRVGVRDISPTGCRIDMAEQPAIGETFHLKIDGFETLESRVCWIDGTIVGLQFAEPIHRAVFGLLALRLGK